MKLVEKYNRRVYRNFLSLTDVPDLGKLPVIPLIKKEQPKIVECSGFGGFNRANNLIYIDSNFNKNDNTYLHEYNHWENSQVNFLELNFSFFEQAVLSVIDETSSYQIAMIKDKNNIQKELKNINLINDMFIKTADIYLNTEFISKVSDGRNTLKNMPAQVFQNITLSYEFSNEDDKSKLNNTIQSLNHREPKLEMFYAIVKYYYLTKINNKEASILNLIKKENIAYVIDIIINKILEYNYFEIKRLQAVNLMKGYLKVVNQVRLTKDRT